jgi:hypothetical protein
MQPTTRAGLSIGHSGHGAQGLQSSEGPTRKICPQKFQMTQTRKENF